MTNPYKIVEMFEREIADYCGSEYAVAVESCTAALFLSMQWRKIEGWDIKEVSIPKYTYPGVACSIIHCGWKIKFEDKKWEGEYEINPLNIWDAALRFKKRMYHGGFQCVSFHIKKLINLGRGGAILTDNFDAVKWLRKARFDGRSPVPLKEDMLTQLGWNFYMPPPDAARGLQLLQILGDKELNDLSVESQGYSDLSIQPAYKNYIV